jgi:uncharacterized protein (UPF0335 family)
MAYPKNTVDSDSVAQDQIRAFVERIMRMREEAKAINDDIREIYAEAKANGFDKTVLGKVVLHVERRSTKAAEMLEAQALFDLYLEAIDGTGTRIALTHTHEKSAGASQERAQTATGVGTGGDHLGPASRSMATAKTDVPTHQSQASGDGQSQHNSGVRVTPVDTISETHDGEPSETLGTAAEPTGEADAASPVPARMTAADNARSIRPWCLNADDLSKCAGQGRKHCHGCLKAHADAEGLSA